MAVASPPAQLQTKEEETMNRKLVFIYGALSYATFLATFLYAVGFIGNFAVPKSMDSPADGRWQTALLIDLGLLKLFALQHSIMARPAFKRQLTRIIPAAAERSTYVLASSLALLLLFWKWRPLGGTVWEIHNALGQSALYAAYAFGWAVVLFATVVINHFDLFGLRQVWRNLQGRPQSELKFATPFLYRIVRHPLYVGWITVFWSTPVMTVTHLFFALVTTAYILVAIQFGKRRSLVGQGAPRAMEGSNEDHGAHHSWSGTFDLSRTYRAGGRATTRHLAGLEQLPFLWLDESPERVARVRRGEVVVMPVVGHGSEGVPNGLVHDWIGAVFIPDATIDGLLAVVHDYDRYKHVYRPVVTSSRTLSCSDAGQQFEMVWQRKVVFVSAAMHGRYQAHDTTIDAHHGYSVAETVEVREIANYGHPGEHLLPPDTGNGFMWRIRSLARFEERDGGVYLELEAIALTRDIPTSLAWMVNPMVNHLSIHSLTATLRQTRDAVISLRGNPEALLGDTATNPRERGRHPAPPR
jgi:protein-S-isoprenylcysteine O-methyltransferase Ste14